MKKATFLFQCRLTTAASFSAYKGSMLRGSLGTFLKKTCCTVRRNSCDDCMLAHGFEPVSEETCAKLEKIILDFLKFTEDDMTLFPLLDADILMS